MKKTVILFPALVALFLGSCMDQKKVAHRMASQDNERLFTEYLSGKERLKDTAVTYAMRQLPRIIKLSDKIELIDPGAYHRKAILVLIKAWGQDSVKMLVYEKNVVKFKALSPDNELDLRRIIHHDERMMESLPNGIGTDLKEYVLSKDEDIFWAKAILGEENWRIAQKIIAGDYAPDAVSLYYSVTGDTALAHAVTKMISGELILKYNMENSAPPEKKWRIAMEMPLADGIRFLERNDSSEVKKLVQVRSSELTDTTEIVALYKKGYLSKKQASAMLLRSVKTAKERDFLQRSYPEILNGKKRSAKSPTAKNRAPSKTRKGSSKKTGKPKMREEHKLPPPIN